MQFTFVVRDSQNNAIGRYSLTLGFLALCEHLDQIQNSAKCKIKDSMWLSGKITVILL